ncbi:hypothetical protein [Hymenobacter edaphi]|uniref:hypothetical protein n=1 Tax=Hymenobacter edaphi TaxID=2211146 RepID=UPI0010577474|nr:hypothetical protein [Hymenobacter edaphi]
MKALIGLFISLYALPVTCQTARYSRKAPILIVNIYVNNQAKKCKIKSRDITLRSSTRVFAVRDSAGLLILPRIEKTDTLDIVVKFGRRSVSMNRIPGWRLQPGAIVSVGRINDFEKVVSIAKQNEMLPTEADYPAMNNSYGVSPEGVIMQVPDITRFNYVDYITVVGYGQGTMMTTWQGKLK